MTKYDQEKRKTCLRVGVTGGIGSGKSTVCRIFEALGIPVFDADEQARHLILFDPEIRRGIIDLFGPDAYTPDGAYNRRWVAEKVFTDRPLLDSLNRLVHPAVERASDSWHLQHCGEGVPYTIKEAALLIESGNYRFLDALIVVSAPEALRIRRVTARDGLPEAAVEARIRNQATEAERLAHADFVVQNDGTRKVVPQVWHIHQQLCARAMGE